MNKLSLLTSILFIRSYLSITIETSGKKDSYCFSKLVEQGDKLNLSYIVTGDDKSEKCNALIKDEDENILFSLNDQPQGNYFEKEVNKAGKHTACFFGLEGKLLYISMEFYSNNEKGHTLDLATDTNFHDLKKDTVEIASLLENIEQNTRFIMDRRNKHSEIISGITGHITNASYLKIFIVILISLLQVFLIQKFYGGNERTPKQYTSNVYEMSGL